MPHPTIQHEIGALDLAGAEWRKSPYSGNTGGNCVEVADVSGGVAVRHSKQPGGPVLVFTSSEWAAFVAGVRDGVFDLT